MHYQHAHAQAHGAKEVGLPLRHAASVLPRPPVYLVAIINTVIFDPALHVELITQQAPVASSAAVLLLHCCRCRHWAYRLPWPSLFYCNLCSQNMLFVEASAKTAACVSDIFESVAAKLAGGLPVSVGARAAM